MPTIVVRFRRKKSYPHGTRDWENSWTHEFKSWRKAWEYVEGSDDEHPLTGKRVGQYVDGDSLRNHARRYNVGEVVLGTKDDLYFIDVWGIEEQAEKMRWLAELEANRKRLVGEE